MATFKAATNKATVYLPMNFQDGWHLAKLMSVEDSHSELYGTDGYKWVWHLATFPDRDPIVDERGAPFEMWQFTGSSLGIDRKTGGPTIARKNAEALLGRPLQEGEVLDDSLLVGRYLKGLVILNEKDRLQFTKLEPYKTAAKAPTQAKAAPKPPPEEPPDEALMEDQEPEETDAIPF